MIMSSFEKGPSSGLLLWFVTSLLRVAAVAGATLYPVSDCTSSSGSVVSYFNLRFTGGPSASASAMS